jgi:HrpA-like RNA helicase
MGRVNSGVPQVPYAAVNQGLLPFRQALPVWSMRENIVNSINSNQVVLISGDTGSGKTTQVKFCQIKAFLRLGSSCNISVHQNFPPVWIFFISFDAIQ